MSGDAVYLSRRYAREHVRWARRQGIWLRPEDAFDAIDERCPDKGTWESVIETLARAWRGIMED